VRARAQKVRHLLNSLARACATYYGGINSSSMGYISSSTFKFLPRVKPFSCNITDMLPLDILELKEQLLKSYSDTIGLDSIVRLPNRSLNVLSVSQPNASFCHHRACQRMMYQNNLGMLFSWMRPPAFPSPTVWTPSGCLWINYPRWYI